MVLGLPKSDVERLRRQFRLLKAGLFGVAVLAVVLFLTVTDVVRDLRTGWALRFDGVDATGQVTRMSTKGKGKTLEMFVEYAFDVDGLTFSGENSTSATLFKSLYNGAPIAVRYVANDPNRSMIVIFGEYPGLRASGSCVLFLTLLMFVLPGLSSLMAASYRMAYLRKADLRRAAVVTGLVTSPYYHDKGLSSITWHDETGAAGQSRMMTATRLPNIGATITVYADPENELPAIWDGEFGKG